MTDAVQEADYIIVGAGSAGCVLAERLSADARFSVLLIEAGPADGNPLIHMPKGFGKLLSNPDYTWVFPTEPEAGNGQRGEYWLRGKVLGGSSSINGMVYVRGQPQDYDSWDQWGLHDWSWRVMAPYFKRMEDHALGADEVRGAGGPLGVSRSTQPYALADAVIEAGRALGIPVKQDLNRPDQEGIGYLCATIKAGRRQSAAQAFLRRARSRSNLHVLTHTTVQKILFEGTRAVGVVANTANSTLEFRARREVIIATGALQTPKLLQLSGVGPGQILQNAGIKVLIDSAGVGQNLREHRLLFLQHRLKRGSGLNKTFAGIPLVIESTKYLLARRGAMASGSYDVGGFVRTRPELDRPDGQLMMAPYSLDFAAQSYKFEDFPGMQVFGYVLRPESQGTIHIRSSNPADPPKIHPNYLAVESDRVASIGLVRLMRRWMAQAPLASFVGEETTPGVDVQTDEQIVAAFARLGQSGYHACGTCRMGVDEAAPLDGKLRVRGAENLRVVDLSMFPTMISGNTNGPMMALAWRAADLIAADAR